VSPVFSTNVFNDVMVGVVTAVTDPKFDEMLGGGDAIAIQLVADQITGASTITIALEHSGDRRNWVTKTTLINALVLGSVATNVSVATDAGSTPSLGFVRLRITLGSASARVQIYASGRTN
jgi:hypothetical protein